MFERVVAASLQIVIDRCDVDKIDPALITAAVAIAGFIFQFLIFRLTVRADRKEKEMEFIYGFLTQIMHCITKLETIYSQAIPETKEIDDYRGNFIRLFEKMLLNLTLDEDLNQIGFTSDDKPRITALIRENAEAIYNEIDKCFCDNKYRYLGRAMHERLSSFKKHTSHFINIMNSTQYSSAQIEALLESIPPWNEVNLQHLKTAINKKQNNKSQSNKNSGTNSKAL